MSDTTDGQSPLTVFRPPEQKRRYNSATSESDLVLRTKAGDREAFDALMERVMPHSVRLVRHLMPGKPEDAEDILVECTIRAYEHIHSFRGACSFKTWFFRIAVRLVYDFNHKNKLANALTDPLTNDSDNTQSIANDPRTSDPLKLLERSETTREVSEAINALPAIYEEVIRLREIDGLTYDEIAKRIGCSSKTVATRLHRGRKILSRTLSHYIEGEGV